MKRLKKIVLSQAEFEPNFLSIELQRMILGGCDSKTDCLFQVMGYIQYKKDLAAGLPSLGQENYADLYRREYELQYGSGTASAGVETDKADDCLYGHFTNISMDRDSAGRYKLDGDYGVAATINRGGYVVANIVGDPNQSVGHAVLLTGFSWAVINGVRTAVCNYYDPQNNVSGIHALDRTNIIAAVQ